MCNAVRRMTETGSFCPPEFCYFGVFGFSELILNILYAGCVIYQLVFGLYKK